MRPQKLKQEIVKGPNGDIGTGFKKNEHQYADHNKQILCTVISGIFCKKKKRKKERKSLSKLPV